MNRILKLLTILIAVPFLFSCNGGNNASYTNVKHPEWVKSAVIYEVNVRQFTPEGTFAAFDTHLERLSDLGVDILWFMPVHPIGVEARKGSLGSYYSVQNYTEINPEFGTLEDFKATVNKAHALGFKVILDWVANHTSRDHSWITEHPEWYVKDSTGAILAPFDWTDVAKLDYSNKEMRKAMTEALKFWVVECGIDGYRCDVAEQVPTDFWESAFRELRKIRSDLFFLAEAENPPLQVNAFNAYYGWEMHHYMNALAQGKKSIAEFNDFLLKHAERFPQRSIALNFTSNHDENSWNGTEFERMGDAVRQFAAFSFLMPGIPLIYSGQEVGFNHRLEFFEKDNIVWNDPEDFTSFYKELIRLRDAHPSMHTPAWGAAMKVVETSLPEKVFAFERTLADDGFVASFNFSSEPVTFTVRGREVSLPAWGYDLYFLERFRVEPLSWWVGMKTPLQLMIKGEFPIKDSKVEVTGDYSGVKVTKVHNADNPLYLFVDVDITDKARAKNYVFSVTTPDGQVLYFNYLIEKRREGSAERVGFGASDALYLLMPDRFANGDPSNDTTPCTAEPGNRGNLAGRHGGDLQGIINNLDYLADLGVTTIWPTPILLDNEPNYSYHGYACADYYKVDPRFGTNELYKKMVSEAHARGLKFIQDIVVNHCGTAHWWYQNEPFNDWISKFDTFTKSNFMMSTHSDPHSSLYDRDLCVKGWFDTSMPDMNLSNEYLLRYFTQWAVWWIESADLDGIRVDTYPYSDKNKVAEWSGNVLKEYPRLTILGECWFHSPTEIAYWEGGKTKNSDGFNSNLTMVMDFVLQDHISAFNENAPIPDWDKGIKRVYTSLSMDNVYSDPYNLLVFMSNHDTPRPAHILGGDVSRMKNAYTLILTTRGVPQLYTGDEVMLRSADGTIGHCQERVDFPGGWQSDAKSAFTAEGRSKEQNELFNHVRTLLNWRKTSKAICEGRLKHFCPDAGSNAYIYFREVKGTTSNNLVMVAINNSTAPYSINWDIYKEVFGDNRPKGRDVLTGVSVSVGSSTTLPPMTSMVVEF